MRALTADLVRPEETLLAIVETEEKKKNNNQPGLCFCFPLGSQIDWASFRLWTSHGFGADLWRGNGVWGTTCQRHAVVPLVSVIA